MNASLLSSGTLNSGDLGESMYAILEKLDTLVDTVFPYLIGILAVVAVIWGVYIGVRIAIANKNEEQINARGMVRNFIIGILIIAVFCVVIPLIIEGLAAWAGVGYYEVTAAL